MKHFIKNVLRFLLPIVVLAFPMDLGISYLLSQKKGIFAGEMDIWENIYHSNIDCDIAILGSSRAWVHINPEVLEDSLQMSAYNFGLDGHNFWLQHLRHSEYLKHNKKPKHIIVSLDVYGLEKQRRLYNYAQFMPYMLWNKNIYKYTSPYRGFRKIDYFIPLVRYFGKTSLLNSCVATLLNKNQDKPLRKDGFANRDKQWSSDLARAKKEHLQYKIDIDPEIVRLFESFIKASQQDSIELTLVYTPEYIEGQEFVSNREDIINLYRHIAQKYELIFYDYSDDSLCFDKSFFYNASHLNKEGSRLFNRKLANNLKKSYGL